MTARRPRRLAALLSVVPVLVAGTTLFAAPAANAATTSLGCRLYFSDAGTGSSPSTYTDTFSWSQTGDQVSFSASTGVLNGPVNVNANQLNARVIVEWSGGSATLSSGGYPTTAKAPYVAMGAWEATGTVSVPAGTTLTVKQLKFDDSSTYNVDTYCSASGDRDQKASPAATSLTYTTSGASSPTTTSASPTTTSVSPTSTSASPTTTSASPTTTSSSPTTSASPTTSTTPPSSDVEAVTVTGLNCEILGQAKAWTAPALSSGTASADPKFSFGADKLTVTKGQKVTFTLTYDQGPAVGPVTIPKGALKPMAKVKVSGAGAGTAILVGPVNTADIVGYAAGNPTGWNAGQTLTGSFTATADGTVTAVLEEVAFDYGDTTAGASFGWPTTVEDLDSVCNKGAKPKTAAVSIALEAQEGTVPTASPTASTSTSTTTTDDTDTDTDGSGDDGNNGTLAATGPGEAFTAMIWALVALQVGLIIVVRMARRRPVPASASSTRAARRRTPGQPWARTRGRHR